jgi:hypothetical protein
MKRKDKLFVNGFERKRTSLDFDLDRGNSFREAVS